MRRVNSNGAHIPMTAGAGIGDVAIASTISVGGSTVYRTKRRFMEGNLELALSEEARLAAPRKLSGKEAALLVATACSSPPDGRRRCTLNLLADAMVELTDHDGLSRETVRRRMAEDDLKPGLRFLDPHKFWRHAKVKDRRTACGFAVCMRHLSAIHYPDADPIRVVSDTRSTHTAGALYKTFPASEARRILQSLEFHHTAKHASWLNRVEIEIGVPRGQCLDWRIDEREVVVTEIDASQRQRNASGARSTWTFTTEKARNKLARVYRDILKESKSV